MEQKKEIKKTEEQGAISKIEVTIVAVSTATFGIKGKDEKWYNRSDNLTDIQKQSIDTMVGMIGKGDIIELDMRAGKYIEIVMKKKNESWADDIVNFETLLTEAHKKGLYGIATEKLFVDFDKKQAIFKATVTGKVGTDSKGLDLIGSFQGHGDTTIENIESEFVKPHFMRMCESRAICRALRWFVNQRVAEEEKK